VEVVNAETVNEAAPEPVEEAESEEEAEPVDEPETEKSAMSRLCPRPHLRRLKRESSLRPSRIK